METRRLEYFVRIADAGSISRAAADVGVAQPALSKQLAILEGQLKTRLVERSANGVTLTRAGQALYARAHVILRQVASLRMDLQAGAHGLAGVVAVGLAASHGLRIGGALVARARERHPNLRLQVSEATSDLLMRRLQDGLIDLALVPGGAVNPGHGAEALFTEELLLVTARGAPPPPSDLRELAALPWIATSAQNALRGALGAIFAQAEAEPNVVAEINSLPLVLRAVEDGVGVTVLPMAAVGDALARSAVSAWPFPTSPLHRTVYLCVGWKPSGSGASAAIGRLLREIAAEEFGTAPASVTRSRAAATRSRPG